MIVLDGRLFAACLDSAGDMVVREIDEGFVVFYRTIAGHRCCPVHVVTAGRLDTFCNEALEVATRLKAILDPDLEELQEEIVGIKPRR